RHGVLHALRNALSTWHLRTRGPARGPTRADLLSARSPRTGSTKQLRMPRVSARGRESADALSASGDRRHELQAVATTIVGLQGSCDETRLMRLRHRQPLRFEPVVEGVDPVVAARALLFHPEAMSARREDVNFGPVAGSVECFVKAQDGIERRVVILRPCEEERR